MAVSLAETSDLAAIWREPTSDELPQVFNLLRVASAKLRHACPFDLDSRIALYATDPAAVTALDPELVANVVATIVKRVLVNPDGLAMTTETVGPFSRSQSFVTRTDANGADARGGIHVTASDIQQLLPAVLTRLPQTISLEPTTRMAARGPSWIEVAPGVYSDRGAQYDPVTGEPLYYGWDQV